MQSVIGENVSPGSLEPEMHSTESARDLDRRQRKHFLVGVRNLVTKFKKIKFDERESSGLDFLFEQPVGRVDETKVARLVNGLEAIIFGDDSTESQFFASLQQLVTQNEANCDELKAAAAHIAREQEDFESTVCGFNVITHGGGLDHFSQWFLPARGGGSFEASPDTFERPTWQRLTAAGKWCIGPEGTVFTLPVGDDSYVPVSDCFDAAYRGHEYDFELLRSATMAVSRSKVYLADHAAQDFLCLDDNDSLRRIVPLNEWVGLVPVVPRTVAEKWLSNLPAFRDMCKAAWTYSFPELGDRPLCVGSALIAFLYLSSSPNTCARGWYDLLHTVNAYAQHMQMPHPCLGLNYAVDKGALGVAMLEQNVTRQAVETIATVRLRQTNRKIKGLLTPVVMMMLLALVQPCEARPVESRSNSYLAFIFLFFLGLIPWGRIGEAFVQAARLTYRKKKREVDVVFEKVAKDLQTFYDTETHSYQAEGPLLELWAQFLKKSQAWMAPETSEFERDVAANFSVGLPVFWVVWQEICEGVGIGIDDGMQMVKDLSSGLGSGVDEVLFASVLLVSGLLSAPSSKQGATKFQIAANYTSFVTPWLMTCVKFGLKQPSALQAEGWDDGRLEQFQETLRRWKDLKYTPLGRSVNELISAFIVYPLLPALPPDLQAQNLLKWQADVSNLMNQHECSITGIVASFVYVLRTMVKLIEDRTLHWDLRALKDDLWVKCNDHNSDVETGAYAHNGKDVVQIRNDYNAMIAQYKQTLPTLRGADRNIVQSRLILLAQWQKKLSRVALMGEYKAQPLTILLFGAPGTGKSSGLSFLHKFVNKVREDLDPKYERCVVHIKNEHDKYDSGHTEDVTNVIVDDLGIIKAAFKTQSSATFVQNMTSTTYTPTLQADVELKGCVFNLAHTMICTSNKPDGGTGQEVVEPDAMFRRFGICYEMDVDASVKVEVGGSLIPDRLKLKDAADPTKPLQDFQRFRRYRLRSKNGVAVVVPLTEWMGAKEFLIDLRTCVREYEMIEQQNKRQFKSGKELAWCEHCMPIVYCSLCEKQLVDSMDATSEFDSRMDLTPEPSEGTPDPPEALEEAIRFVSEPIEHNFQAEGDMRFPPGGDERRRFFFETVNGEAVRQKKTRSLTKKKIKECARTLEVVDLIPASMRCIFDFILCRSSDCAVFFFWVWLLSFTSFLLSLCVHNNLLQSFFMIATLTNMAVCGLCVYINQKFTVRVRDVALCSVTELEKVCKHVHRTKQDLTKYATWCLVLLGSAATIALIGKSLRRKIYPEESPEECDGFDTVYTGRPPPSVNKDGHQWAAPVLNKGGRQIGSRGMSLEQAVSLSKRCQIVGGLRVDGGKVSLFKGMLLNSYLALVPAHTFDRVEDECEMHLVLNLDGGGMPGKIDLKFSKKLVYFVPNRDLAVFNIHSRFGNRVDIRKLLPTSPVLGFMEATVVRFTHDFSQSDSKHVVKNWVSSYLNPVSGVEHHNDCGLDVDVGGPTAKGMCGDYVMHRTPAGTALLGMWVAGDGARYGYAATLLVSELEKAEEWHAEHTQYHTPLTVVKPALVVGDYSETELNGVHPKNPVNFTETTGLPPIVETVIEKKQTPRTNLVYNEWLTSVTKHFCVPCNWKPAPMNECRNMAPYYQNVYKPRELMDQHILNLAVADFKKVIDGVFPKVQALRGPAGEEWAKCLAQPYNLDMVLGFDEATYGNPLVTRLNSSTSAGSPFNKPKNKVFETDEQNRLLLPEAVIDEMARQLMAMGFDEHAGGLYKLVTKDEARALNKTEARLFAAGPVCGTLLMKIYFDGMINSMAQFPAETECLLGVNCLDPSFSEICKYFCTPKGFENGVVMSDEDVKGWDVSMNNQLKHAALEIFTHWVQLCGWNKADTDTAMRLAESYFISPLVDAMGVVTCQTSFQPSGVTLTGRFNSMMNSLLQRYCWYSLNPTLNFNDYVRVLTMGDDINKCMAAEHSHLFEPETVRDILDRIGIVVTSADKLSSTVVWKDPKMDAVEIIGRQVIFSEDLGHLVAVLRAKSMPKGIMLMDKENVRDTQVHLEVMHMMLLESLPKGYTEYEWVRSACIKYAEDIGAAKEYGLLDVDYLTALETRLSSYKADYKCDCPDVWPHVPSRDYLMQPVHLSAEGGDENLELNVTEVILEDVEESHFSPDPTLSNARAQQQALSIENRWIWARTVEFQVGAYTTATVFPLSIFFNSTAIKPHLAGHLNYSCTAKVKVVFSGGLMNSGKLMMGFITPNNSFDVNSVSTLDSDLAAMIMSNGDYVTVDLGAGGEAEISTPFFWYHNTARLPDLLYPPPSGYDYKIAFDPMLVLITLVPLANASTDNGSVYGTVYAGVEDLRLSGASDIDYVIGQRNSENSATQRRTYSAEGANDQLLDPVKDCSMVIGVSSPMPSVQARAFGGEHIQSFLPFLKVFSDFGTIYIDKDGYMSSIYAQLDSTKCTAFNMIVSSYTGLTGSMVLNYHMLGDGIMQINRGFDVEHNFQYGGESGVEVLDTRVNPTTTVVFPAPRCVRWFAVNGYQPLPSLPTRSITALSDTVVGGQGLQVAQRGACYEDVMLLHFKGMPLITIGTPVSNPGYGRRNLYAQGGGEKYSSKASAAAGVMGATGKLFAAAGLPALAVPMEIAAALGKVASDTLRSHGHSRPLDSSLSRAVPATTNSMHNSNANILGTMLALDRDFGTSPDGILGCLGKRAETDFGDIWGRRVPLGSFNWTPASAPGVVLQTINVTPVFENVVAGKAALSGQALICHLFRFWSGTIEYEFEVTTLPTIAANLAITYEPAPDMATRSVGESSDTNRTLIMNISEFKKAKVTVHMETNRIGLKTCAMQPISPLGTAYDLTRHNGQLGVYVHTPLTSSMPFDVPNATVSVWARCIPETMFVWDTGANGLNGCVLANDTGRNLLKGPTVKVDTGTLGPPITSAGPGSWPFLMEGPRGTLIPQPVTSSSAPHAAPSGAPANQTTGAPHRAPTSAPHATPTNAPNRQPTRVPTKRPTLRPSQHVNVTIAPTQVQLSFTIPPAVCYGGLVAPKPGNCKIMAPSNGTTIGVPYNCYMGQPGDIVLYSNLVIHSSSAGAVESVKSVRGPNGTSINMFVLTVPIVNTLPGWKTQLVAVSTPADAILHQVEAPCPNPWEVLYGSGGLTKSNQTSCSVANYTNTKNDVFSCSELPAGSSLHPLLRQGGDATAYRFAIAYDGTINVNGTSAGTHSSVSMFYDTWNESWGGGAMPSIGGGSGGAIAYIIFPFHFQSTVAGNTSEPFTADVNVAYVP